MQENKFSMTIFPSKAATSKEQIRTTVKELAARIERTSARTKTKLPWLKLATFGDLKSINQSFRTNKNVLSVSGIELDYDGKKMTVGLAAETMKKADICSLIYTSASHTPEAPKWRLLAPFSTDRPPGDRLKNLTKIAHLFGASFDVAVPMFDRASLVLSQGYYYGRVDGNEHHQVVVVDGGLIDLRDDIPTDMKLPRATEKKQAPIDSDVDPEFVRAALRAMFPIGGRGDEFNWQAWNRICMAVHAALDGASGDDDYKFGILDEWASRHDGYDPKYTRQRWETLHKSPPTDLGIGTLIYEANLARGPGWQAAYDQEMELVMENANRKASGKDPLKVFRLPTGPSAIARGMFRHVK